MVNKKQTAKIIIGILTGLWTIVTWSFLVYMVYAYIVYPISEHKAWDLLPHLCCEPIQFIPIYMHIGGAILMIVIAPFQLSNALKKTCAHNYTGILFVIGGILTSMDGIIFMNFNGTVGGRTMTVPFTVAGVLLFICVLGVTSTIVNRRFDLHRPWVFRLYLQGTASVFYRVLYTFAFLHYGRWHVTFHDPIDMWFNWLYFLIPLAIGELGITLYYYVDWNRCCSSDSMDRIIINPVEDNQIERLIVN